MNRESISKPFGGDPKEIFERIISPVTYSEFFDLHWERKYLHLNRQDKNYYTGISSMVDSCALQNPLVVPVETVSVYHHQKPVPSEKYTVPIRSSNESHRTLNATALRALYAQGATVFFEDLSLMDPSIRRIQIALSTLFSHPMQVGGYFTPPNSTGLSTHCDYYDIFALQVSGSKRWRIYESQPMHPVPGTNHSEYMENYPHGALLDEFTLNAGDCLYLPRGCYHSAETEKDFSIHLTFAFACTHWHQIIAKIAHDAQHLDPEFRRALPIGYSRSLNKKSFLNQAHKDLKNFLKLLLDEDLLVTALSETAASMVKDYGYSGTPIEFDVEDNFEFDENTRFMKSEASNCYYTVEEDKQIKLYFDGRKFALSKKLASILDSIIAVEDFSAIEISSHSDITSTNSLISFLQLIGFIYKKKI